MAAQFTADLNPKVSNQLSISEMLKIGNYMNQLETSGLEAEKASIEKRELPAVMGFIQDKSYINKDGSYNYDAINTVLPAIAPLSGAAYAKKLTELGTNDTAARKAKLELNQGMRSIIGQVYGAHALAGTQDPQLVANSLLRLADEQPELRGYVDPAVKNLLQVPAGGDFTKKLFQARNEFMTMPQQIEAFAPKANLAELGGKTYQTVTQGSVLGEQPTISATEVGEAKQPVLPSGNKTEPAGSAGGITQPKVISYSPDLKFRGSESAPQLNSLQKPMYENGLLMFKTANENAGSAAEAKQSIRKANDYLTQASGSAIGRGLRSVGQWFAGNPELETLVKNLADLSVREAQIRGASTDAAKADVAKISGSDKITSEALKGILQRYEATATAAQMYNDGLTKFRDKSGTVNGAIQAENFRNAWNANYDPRIFMLDNINKSDMSESDKKAARAKLGEGMSESERKAFAEKAKNIHRLTQGVYEGFR